MGRGCSKAAIELGLDWQTIEQSVHFIVAMAEANQPLPQALNQISAETWVVEG